MVPSLPHEGDASHLLSRGEILARLGQDLVDNFVILENKTEKQIFQIESCSQWREERILWMTATSSPRSVVFLQPRQLRAAVQVITSLAVNYLRKLVLSTPNLRPLKCNPVSPCLFLRFCSREVEERYLFESNFHIRASSLATSH